MGVPPWVFCMMQGSELGDSWIEIDSNVFKMAFEKENVCSYVHAVMPWSTTCCRRQSNSNFLEIINGRTNQIVVEARIAHLLVCSAHFHATSSSLAETGDVTGTVKSSVFYVNRSTWTFLLLVTVPIQYKYSTPVNWRSAISKENVGTAHQNGELIDFL